MYTIIPLSIIVLVGILKELLADLKRYNIDKKTNAAVVNRLTGKITEINRKVPVSTTKTEIVMKTEKKNNSRNKKMQGVSISRNSSKESVVSNKVLNITDSEPEEPE